MNNPYKGFQVFLSKKSQKFFTTITLEQKIILIDALDMLTTQAYLMEVKKLQGYKKFYRQRVGDYRIIFEPDFKQKNIYVYIIAHRKDVYEKMSRLK